MADLTARWPKADFVEDPVALAPLDPQPRVEVWRAGEPVEHGVRKRVRFARNGQVTMGHIVIDLDAILGQVRDVMDKAAFAVQAVFLFTLLAGLAVAALLAWSIGPAAAGWIAMMWGSEIMDAYLTFSGLR